MLYLDASAWVKRYVRERGREGLEHQMRTAGRLWSSAITYAEVHAALARKHRDKEMDQVEFMRAGNDFERDWLLAEEVAVDQETLSPVREILKKVSLRGMDVIHLAALLWLQRKLAQRPVFISSDPRLLRATQSFGFETLDPAQAGSS